MLLKFESDEDELYLLESVGEKGVSLNKWTYLRECVGTNEYYQRAVFRHINFERNDKMVENLETFLKEALGQKYGLTVGTIFRRNTELKVDREIIDTERTFFCSELVAKAFKTLGILVDNNTSCSQFYPHHFGARGDSFLKLTDKTIIESEMQVILSDEQKERLGPFDMVGKF